MAISPYATALPFIGTKVIWANPEDQIRLAAYALYEEMYWSANTKGIDVQDGTPLSAPAAKTLVETIHRFLAVNWRANITGGSDAGQQVARDAFTKLFKRENMAAKFSNCKRFGLIRGDALLHVVADPEKEAGTRISIYDIDPGAYFPIYDLEETEKLIGCHLVEETIYDEKPAVIRQSYYREMDEETGLFTGVIQSQVGIYEPDGWDDRAADFKPEEMKLLELTEPLAPLPPQITQLPIYHWRPSVTGAEPFGSSIYRGIEKLLKAIDQTVTDQDLALALASLGVYATDSGAPTDDQGNDTNWIIGPGRVVEHKVGSKFVRVQGISSVQPSVDHANFLEEKAREAASVPAIAVGDVDVQTAESGIALAIRLSPLMAANKDRELELLGIADQLLYDLATMWFPAYEQITFEAEVVVESIVDDAMPENRDAIIEETMKLLEANLITISMAVAKLTKLGWEYPPEALKELLAQRAAAAAAADPFAARAAGELAASATDPNADVPVA